MSTPPDTENKGPHAVRDRDELAAVRLQLLHSPDTSSPSICHRCPPTPSTPRPNWRNCGASPRRDATPRSVFFWATPTPRCAQVIG
jgi:hypothetical protein